MSDPLGLYKKKRKPFSTQTKKRVWMRAGKHDPEKWRTGFIKTSKCMNPRCSYKRPLKWGDSSYEFDHFDNKNSNNSERNCFLVCLICHSKATKIAKKKEVDRITGWVHGKKTIKKKVGYKTLKRKNIKTKRRRKRRSSLIPKIPKVKFPKRNGL